MTAAALFGLLATAQAAPASDPVRSEHAAIGVASATEEQILPNAHPGAQWFPEAGLGLFIHWGIASVRSMNISWPMIDRGGGGQDPAQ